MAKIILRVSRSEAESLLDDAIQQGNALYERIGDFSLMELWKKWDSWHDYVKTMLEQIVENETSIIQNTPAREFSGVNASKFMKVKLNGFGALSEEEQRKLRGDIVDEFPINISFLESTKKKLPLYEIGANVNSEAQFFVDKDNSIFIVHGRDRATLLEVERFIGRVTDCKPTILGDEPNCGKNLLDKFIGAARRSRYAVVLMTGDDEGRLSTDDNGLKPRARQNVVFELGFFIGALGQENVAVLYEESVELPSDFNGITYISLDGEWKANLGRDLRSAGIEVDMNKA